jgi:hypothetical protein
MPACEIDCVFGIAGDQPCGSDVAIEDGLEVRGPQHLVPRLHTEPAPDRGIRRPPAFLATLCVEPPVVRTGLARARGRPSPRARRRAPACVATIRSWPTDVFDRELGLQPVQNLELRRRVERPDPRNTAWAPGSEKRCRSAGGVGPSGCFAMNARLVASALVMISPPDQLPDVLGEMRPALPSRQAGSCRSLHLDWVTTWRGLGHLMQLLAHTDRKTVMRQ